MKYLIIYFACTIVSLASCNDDLKERGSSKKSTTNMDDSTNFRSGYSEVNGIRMYYEIYGKGKPLVLIHGGGSTIQTSFERMIPQLSRYNLLIAVELQNHGRTGSRDVPETFEQDADDVAALLNNLEISKASFFGFSNGGTTAMQIAIRHPKIVDKLVLAAAAYKRDGFIPGFFEGMQHATIVNMPQELKTAFLKVNPDSVKLQHMFEKDKNRMINFKDIPAEQVRSITAPTLIINGDADVITVDHTVEIYHMVQYAQLAIIPGGHGKYIKEIATRDNTNKDAAFVANMIREFLDKPAPSK